MEKLLSSTKLDEMADPSHVLDKALYQAKNREANLKTLDESCRSLYHLAADSERTEVIKLFGPRNAFGRGALCGIVCHCQFSIC